MEKIKLSKNAKLVIKAAAEGAYSCPINMTVSDFNNGARELATKGMLYIHEEENGNVEKIKVSDTGKIYLSTQKRLMNPVNWSMIAAIYDVFTPEQLGVARQRLCAYGITPEHPYKNKVCAIYCGVIHRTKTKRSNPLKQK